MGSDWLADTETVVWRVSADDPELYRDTAHPAEDDERDSVAEFAITRGLLLQCVVGDDEVHEMPYVSWWVEVPAALLDATDRETMPPRVDEFVAHLRGRYPPFDNWSACVDEDGTTRLYFESVLRDEYGDLIQALEVALLPLRTEDAARYDALVRVLGVDGPVVIGTYHLYLARQEDGGWLLVRAGIADVQAVRADNKAAQETRRYGLSADTPVLVLPRPASPLFFVQIVRGRYAHGGINRMLWQPPTELPDLVGDYRWVSRSPEELANGVREASSAWWPSSGPRDD